MLLTISTIRQLPQAIALGDSFSHFSANSPEKPVVLIGLADDLAKLPAGFVSPYPLIPIQELIEPQELEALSDMYTPTEFIAACKPLFIVAALKRFPSENTLLFADPNIQFLASLSPIQELLNSKNTILTPFITRNPGDAYWPDEKFFQNIGLYNADFLAFRRSEETNRLLAWWDDRVRPRAQQNYCEGLCLDQIWLMHVPVFFRDVQVVRSPGWHVGLWNLHERTIQQQGNSWLASSELAKNQPLQFINFKGLVNPDEGFFPYQNRLQLSKRPEILTMLSSYRQALSIHNQMSFNAIAPAYGKQQDPVILRGWRHVTAKSLQKVIRFIDKVDIPVFN